MEYDRVDLASGELPFEETFNAVFATLPKNRRDRVIGETSA